MLNFEIISLVLFALILGGIAYRDRKNIEFHSGLAVRKWTKGLELIDSFVKSHPRFTTFIGNLGVVVAIIASISGIIFLIHLTLQFQQTFSFVLPTAGGYNIPGPVISVPFWYWFIAIFIIASTHETMHAVLARLEKVKVRNYGIIMLLILPIGAFVDPDERGIKRLSLMKKLRIFAAGSFINFVTGILAIVLMIGSLFLFSSLVHTNGIVIDSVVPDSPAEKIGIQGTILYMNNETVKSTFDFVNILNKTKPGEKIFFVTDIGNYDLTLGSNSDNQNKSYVGVNVWNYYEYDFFGSKEALPLGVINVFFSFISFLSWLSGISIGIAFVNILPMKPLDGGLFFEEIFVKLFKERGKTLIKITSILMLILLLFNIIGIPLLRNIF